MKKQVVLPIALALVLGVAAFAVQAADQAKRNALSVESISAESGLSAWSGGTKILDPVGWPVRYDTGFHNGGGWNNIAPYYYFNAWYYHPYGTVAWHRGNLFDTNSGSPLIPTGAILTGVSWVGQMVPYSVLGGPTGLPPNPTAYFVMRPVTAMTSFGGHAAATASTIVPFSAPPYLSYINTFFYSLSPVPFPPAPMGFAAAVVGGRATAGYGAVFNYQAVGQGPDAVRYVTTASGTMSLGYHGVDMSVGVPGLWSLPGANTLLRVRGDLLTPIELLSLTAE